MALSRDHIGFVWALDDCRREAAAIRRQRAVDRGRVMAILTVFFGPVGEAHVERERVLFRGVALSWPEVAEQASAAAAEVTRGRNHLRRVAHYLDAAVAGDPASMAEVRENLLAGASVLRRAIALEDRTLIPLTDTLSATGERPDADVELQRIGERQRKALTRVSCRRIAGALWA